MGIQLRVITRRVDSGIQLIHELTAVHQRRSTVVGVKTRNASALGQDEYPTRRQNCEALFARQKTDLAKLWVPQR